MDIIKERIDTGVCPLCKEITIETKVVEHSEYGLVKICRKHHVDGEPE